MKKLALTLAGLAVVAAAAPAVSASGSRTEYMPCAQEDSNNCVWDAKHQGNGIGRSYFVGRDGKVYPLPHHIAHALIYGGAR